MKLFEASEAHGKAGTPTHEAVHLYIEAVAVARSVSEARGAAEAICKKHKQIKFCAKVYTALLKGCAAARDKAAAYQVMESMKNAEVVPDLLVYHSFITALASARDFKGAEEVLATMRRNSVQVVRASYFRIINGAFQHDEAEVAYQILCRMEEEWRTPDLISYEKMMEHFARLGHAEGQMRCLEGTLELEGGGGAKVMTKVVWMLREQLEQKNQDLKKIATLWALADSRGAEVHWRQTTGVMYAMLQLQRGVDAFKVGTRHIAGGNTISPKMSGMIAYALAKDPSHVDAAYFHLESLKDAGKDVPLQTANIIIEACALIPDLDRAFATWAELSKLSLTPDSDTYNALLSTCVRAREYSSARRLLNRMESDGVASNGQTYSHRCTLHLMQNEGSAALATLRQCKDAELVPPVQLYHSLINYYLRRRPRPNAIAATELLAEMKTYHQNINPQLIRNVDEAVLCVTEDRPFSFATRPLNETVGAGGYFAPRGGTRPTTQQTTSAKAAATPAATPAATAAATGVTAETHV